MWLQKHTSQATVQIHCIAQFNPFRVVVNNTLLKVTVQGKGKAFPLQA
jgi:hypothetical protein